MGANYFHCSIPSTSSSTTILPRVEFSHAEGFGQTSVTSLIDRGTAQNFCRSRAVATDTVTHEDTYFQCGK